MTNSEIKHFKKFLWDVLLIDARIPSLQSDQISDFTCLFNPSVSFFHLLKCFEREKAKSNLKNIVETEVYESHYYNVDRYENIQYFFSFKQPFSQLNSNLIGNVTGLVGQFQESQGMTMTASEAILYVMYKQYCGEDTAFLNQSIVTITTDKKFNVPLVVGFDEKEICNKVRTYNATEMIDESIGIQEVYSQVAYL